MAKIYDAFLFFNELDLLEIRLTMLDPYVDYFVLSECDYTFSGNKKPFYFEENKHLFEKFLHKIIHIKNHNSDDFDNLSSVYEGNKKDVYDKIKSGFQPIKVGPETDYGKGHWCRDYLHREYVSLGLADCNDDDIIIFSDLDEIPNPEVIKGIRELDLSNNYCLYSDSHQYYINNISSTNWMGSVITTYDKLKSDSLCNLRRRRGGYTMIENGGWHLSFVGGIDRIKYKISSWGHQEYNNDYIHSSIESKINRNSDIFDRHNSGAAQHEVYYFDGLKHLSIDGYYPDEIVELVRTKFPYLIKQ